MKLLKVLLAGAAIGVILIAFRDVEQGVWLAPLRENDEDGQNEEEPVLGYDGLDVEGLLDWLGDANLDRATLTRIRDYEAAHRRREPILAAVEDRL